MSAELLSVGHEETLGKIRDKLELCRKPRPKTWLVIQEHL